MEGAVVYELCLLSVTVVETIAVVGVNSIMIMTFLRHQRLLTAMNLYICSMCTSGLISGILAPFGIGPYIGPHTFIGTFAANPCVGQKWKTAVFHATALNNILCMLAIAIERWRSLSSSTQHSSSSKYARIIIAVFWLVSGLYAAFLFHRSTDPVSITMSFGHSTTPLALETYNRTPAAAIDFASEAYATVTSETTEPNFPITMCFSPKRQLVLIVAVITFAASYLIPLFIMAVIYTRLILRLMADVRRAARRLNSLQSAKLRAVQAMVLVVIIFALCWLPGQSLQIWQSSRSLDSIMARSHFTITERFSFDFGTHLAIWNHWIHALVYPFYSRQISLALRETLTFLFCWGCTTRSNRQSENQHIITLPRRKLPLEANSV